MASRERPATVSKIVPANETGSVRRSVPKGGPRLHGSVVSAEAPPPSTASSISFLDRLSDAELETLLSHCVERRVANGTLLFAQSAPHTTTFIVKQGLIRTFYSSPMGKEVTVGFWSTGDLAGGPNFFDESVHVWSGEAAEDSIIWAIDGIDLHRLALSVPAIAEGVIAALSFKLQWVSLLLQNMGTESVRHRLAHLLIALSGSYGKPCPDGILIDYPFTQEDLASMICATRQWVSMMFRDFQKENLVRIVKRRLVILDIEGLHRITKKLPAAD